MEKFCEYCGKRFNAKDPSIQCCSQSHGQLNSSRKKRESESENDHNSSPKQETSNLSQLRVIKGDLFNTVRRVTRTQDLLNFSQSLFWPEKDFSEKKQMELKLLIAEHFRESKDIDQTFRELVERTVLAKRWEDEKDYRSIPAPELWFNINRLDGLYFTHGLYGKMLTQRKTIPSYQYGLTVFSEAILKYCEKKNVLDIYAYREKFIALHRLDLLQYYYNAIMHIQFINL